MHRNPRSDPGLDSELPAAGKRYPRNDNIRFPLPSKNLEQGDLVLRVRDERSNATRHQLLGEQNEHTDVSG